MRYLIFNSSSLGTSVYISVVSPLVDFLRNYASHLTTLTISGSHLLISLVNFRLTVVPKCIGKDPPR